MDSPRKSRNRAACRRCQRRKIRCDGQSPRCGACQKANSPCINDGRQLVQRSYIASMEKRVRWLESLVKKSCPDVNLQDLNENVQDEPSLDEDLEDSLLSPQRGSALAEDQEEAQDTQRNIHVRDHDARPRMEPRQAHEIGLVSLSPGGEPRYIGPSSGYFFANLVFSNAGRYQKQRGVASGGSSDNPRDSSSLAAELLHTPASLPARRESAIELSSKYFETIHISYPFLHQPSHLGYIDQVYSSEATSPEVAFHVYMVLAIAASDLSRKSKVRLPAEGYYATAMQYFSNICPDGSLHGLQCLLLLIVYALHNPSCGINIWNLNYQCLASLIDLGLQRDVRNTPSLRMSLLEQEMRTRVFWVVYTFDRTIGTMMGRPVGIRDEACDLRLPLDISDDGLLRQEAQERTTEQPPSHISFAIHLFKAARLNSEIKYVMHSISREAPAYAYPPIRDIFEWQREMLERLQRWKSEIPDFGSKNNMNVKLCEIRYHEMAILVLRPNPAIPEPTEESSTSCFGHAMDLLVSFRELYRDGSLQYSRLVVHSIFLGTLVVLHSVWKLPDVAANIQIDDLSLNVTAALNILSSIGEYWLEAQRARDCIDEILSATMKRLLKSRGMASSTATSRLRPRTRATSIAQQGSNLVSQMHLGQNTLEQQHHTTSLDINPAGLFDTLSTFPEDGQGYSNTQQLFDDSLFEGSFGLTGVPDFDGLMWEIFNTSSFN